MADGTGVRAGRPAARAVLLVAVLLLAALLGACAGSPSAPPTAGVRADAVGPPEITASAARSPLPAGTPGVGTPPVTIGTKDFTEQFLLGELYTQALRAKGFTVALQQNVGGSEIIDSSFAAGQIQFYPEYLGEIAAGLAHQETSGSPQETYQQAAAFERAQRGATLLDQTPYQNVDVLVVRREYAQRYGLASVPDLARVGSGGDGVTLAAQPPFRTRTSGLAGMQKIYGLTGVTLLAVAPDETYAALDAGQAQVADGFSTDAQLSTTSSTGSRYAELDDPRNIFGFQYVAPVVKQATLDASGPAFAQTCNWVSSLLTVDAVRSMNEQVQVEGADEAAVARRFLAEHGL